MTQKDRVARTDWWLQWAAGSQPLDDNLALPFAGEGSGATRCHFGPLVTVTEDTDVSQIARLFSIHHIKRVPIVREGRIASLVARADLSHVVAATQSQSTGEDKAKHRGFHSLFGEYTSNLRGGSLPSRARPRCRSCTRGRGRWPDRIALHTNFIS